MSSGNLEQLSGGSAQGPVEVKKPMAAKNTYARKKSGARWVAPKPVAAPENSAPMAAGIQSLMSLVSMMRTMNPEPADSPLNPKLVLSGSGVEVSFAEQKPPAGVSEESLNKIEKELKELRQANATLARTVSELEGKLRTQGETVESLRVAVEQNEQMMETLVDSMNMMDDLGDAGLGPELVIPADTLAS